MKFHFETARRGGKMNGIIVNNDERAELLVLADQLEDSGDLRCELLRSIARRKTQIELLADVFGRIGLTAAEAAIGYRALATRPQPPVSSSQSSASSS